MPHCSEPVSYARLTTDFIYFSCSSPLLFLFYSFYTAYNIPFVIIVTTMRNKLLLFVCSFILLFSSSHSFHFFVQPRFQVITRNFFLLTVLFIENIRYFVRYFAKHSQYSKCFLSNIKYLQEFYYFSLKTRL